MEVNQILLKISVKMQLYLHLRVIEYTAVNKW
jgi:hypothetical protein